MFRKPQPKLLVAREWENGEDIWIEFWNDDEKAEKDARNCDFCRYSIYQQLTDGKEIIDLYYSMNCWKTYTGFNNLSECWSVLGELYQTFPNLSFHGKFGKEANPSPKLYLYSSCREEALEWRNRLLYLVKKVKRVDPGFEVKIRKGCESYESLLGHWIFWKEETSIKYRERVPEFLKSLRKYLFESQ